MVLRIVTNDPFHHAARLCGILPLDGNIKDGLDVAGKFLQRLKRDARANFRACTNGGGEADAIQAVIDAHANVPRNLNRLLDEIAEQR